MIFPLELEIYERIAYQHTENVEKTKKLMVQFVIEAIRRVQMTFKNAMKHFW